MEDHESQDIESLCMRCRESNGITRFMLIKVPHFRDLLLASFECHDTECGFRNATVQFGGTFADTGVHYELSVQTKEDLNRQVVKGDYATVRVPELELEIPAESQRGVLTTVEGLLATTAEGLLQDQDAREPAQRAAIAAFVLRLQRLRDLEEPWTVVLDDPSGCSFIQNPVAPSHDPRMKSKRYPRTAAHCALLGLTVDTAGESLDKPAPSAPAAAGAAGAAPAPAAGGAGGAAEPWTAATDRKTDWEREGGAKRATDTDAIVSEGHWKGGCEFQESCFACLRPGVMRSALVDIPNFRETLIMAFHCEWCGARNTEVKPAGGYSAKGEKITVAVRGTTDLSRTVLKSQTCAVSIPEAEIELPEGTLGALVTTVEGLVTQVLEQLRTLPMVSFSTGDSSDGATRQRWDGLLMHLDRLRQGGEPFTLVLDDPVAQSYVQEIAGPGGAPDPQVTREQYERTAEQDEELGINALKALEEEEAAKAAAEAAAAAAGGDAAAAAPAAPVAAAAAPSEGAPHTGAGEATGL